MRIPRLPRAGRTGTFGHHAPPAAAALASGLLAALPAAAQPGWDAMPVTGLYVGGAVGANWATETDLSQSGSLTARLRAAGFPAPGGKASFDTGVVGLGSVGWGFGNGLRAEVEGNYRWNDVDAVSGFGRAGGAVSAGVTNRGGERQTYGLMVNALYDFSIPGAPWAVPYVGAGIGMAWTNFSSSRVAVVPGNPANDVAQLNLSNTDLNFAYQAIAGVAFPIGSVPGLAVTAEYRFFGTLENKLDATVSSVRTGATIASGSVKSDNTNNSLLVGVRYNFGRVPPPPPVVAPAPAPAPAPARTYLVFFDWDRADLTARAREIIADAAQNSRRVQATRIEVAGHADRSGSPRYNQRLSQRRGEAVAAELVRNGVGRDEIAVTAFGESRPLVPTADGVREPQNRRVEIVLR